MTWTLHYKESERGSWIHTVLRGASPHEVWVLWSSRDRVPQNYFAAMVLPLEGAMR